MVKSLSIWMFSGFTHDKRAGRTGKRSLQWNRTTSCVISRLSKTTNKPSELNDCYLDNFLHSANKSDLVRNRSVQKLKLSGTCERSAKASRFMPNINNVSARHKCKVSR